MSGYVVPVSAFDEVLDELADRVHRRRRRPPRLRAPSRTRPLPTTTGTMAGDAVSVLDRLRHRLGARGRSRRSAGWWLRSWRSSRRTGCAAWCSARRLPEALGAKTPPARDILRELKAAGPGVPGGRVRVHPLGALHQAAAAATHDATRRLRHIKAPTLVLHGGADELVPSGTRPGWRRRSPSAELRVVRGGTHLLVLESPVARKALLSWLEEHRARQPNSTPPSPAARLVGTPYRLMRGQTVPLRRAVRAGAALVSRPRLGGPSDSITGRFPVAAISSVSGVDLRVSGDIECECRARSLRDSHDNQGSLGVPRSKGIGYVRQRVI